MAPAIPARAGRPDGPEARGRPPGAGLSAPPLRGVAVPVVHRLRGLHTQHDELLPRAGDAR